MTSRTDRLTTHVTRTAAIVAMAALLGAARPQTCAASDHAAASVLRYQLTCLLEEDRARVRCTAGLWIRILRDSLPSVTFRLPASAAVTTVNDANDRSTDYIRVRAEAEPESFLLQCTLPDAVGMNDSVFFRIGYTAFIDTSSSAPSFLNEREFILDAHAGQPWVPLLAHAPQEIPSSASHAVIELYASPSYTILSGGVVDSADLRDGKILWRITRTDARNWMDAFTIAGSKAVQARSSAASPGCTGVTLYTPAAGFDTSFAHSLVEMLGRASAYFAARKYVPRFDRLTFASVGQETIASHPVVAGSLVLVRTGPEHARFDSSAFVLSAHNVWLLETARVYAFDVPDSSYWFDESWTGYCATRFLFAGADTDLVLQMNERTHILSHALNFYPEPPLAAGRRRGGNGEAVFTYKGRYVFLMLDYVMGRESFDGVMQQVYAEALTGQAPTITRLQALCEHAYGSSLSWFFDQWLYRTGFPEFVLTSSTTPTARGTYEVTVTVAQRGDVFVMPLNIYFETATRSFLKRIFVSQEEQRFVFTLPSQPRKVEWNPQNLVLRWVQKFRILAHARTSTSYRVNDRDLAMSEKEAHLALQLDPANSIGANVIALYSLGKAAGARSEWARADSLFLEASRQHASGELSFYPLLSAVRHGNILEIIGQREEALAIYRKALEEAERDPLSNAKVIVEARRFMAEPFAPTGDIWYAVY